MQLNDKLVSVVNRILPSFPATITSWTRTARHNAAIGGAPHSAHVTGDAVDMIFDSPGDIESAALLAYKLGVPGIEIDVTNNHLHLDMAQRIWHVYHTAHGETPFPKPVAEKS